LRYSWNWIEINSPKKVVDELKFPNGMTKPDAQDLADLKRLIKLNFGSDPAKLPYLKWILQANL